MSEADITVSIVTYKTSPGVLKRCIESILRANMKINIYVIDNSPEDYLRTICSNNGIFYIFNDNNVGFGAGHNIAIKETIKDNIPFHLVTNPDIHFGDAVLEPLYEFMNGNTDVGVIMPKILYVDGSVQYLCKLLPTPMDLIRRRFFGGTRYSGKKDSLYELRSTGYDKIMDVPYLSGCFMFIRTEALSRAGLFDERFFLYLEDVDLSRRIHKHYRTVYYPDVSVFHQYEKGSYKNSKLLKYHLQSAIRYFNKWGYFFDKDRREINEKTLKKLNAL